MANGTRNCTSAVFGREWALTGLRDTVEVAVPATLFACGAGDGNRTRTVSLGTNLISRIHCVRQDDRARRGHRVRLWLAVSSRTLGHAEGTEWVRTTRWPGTTSDIDCTVAFGLFAARRSGSQREEAMGGWCAVQAGVAFPPLGARTCHTVVRWVMSSSCWWWLS